MNHMMESLLFAGIMTTLDELKEQKVREEELRQELLEARATNTQTAIQTDNMTVSAYIDLAMKLMDEMVTSANEETGTESEWDDYRETYNLIWNSVAYEVAAKQKVPAAEKAIIFDTICRIGEASMGALLGQEIFIDHAGDDPMKQLGQRMFYFFATAGVYGDCPDKFKQFIFALAEIAIHADKELSDQDIQMSDSHNSVFITVVELAIESCRQVIEDGKKRAEDDSSSNDLWGKNFSTSESGGSFTMDEFSEYLSPNEVIRKKLRAHFDGKIVRKDLTKKIKEGANVPVYVLEFLLGRYCSSDDPEIIDQGIETVKHILADNFVRPDEAQKVLSSLRQSGSHSVIDMVTVQLDIKHDCYVAEFSNLGLKGIPISEEYPTKYDRLLCGGIWCNVLLDYEYIEEDKKASPITIRRLKPIQMPTIDLNELKNGRKAFSKEEWLDVLMRSIGMEPDELTYRQKWLLLARMLPLVENNFNLCELGPRSTGKSHLYKEISPNSILISGGQTTVANLFYNMARKTVGLVGLWDCVAFDEVAGINFKDKDGIQIMKDYMASGSFARGKEEKAASASMVFVGNVNQPVDVLLKTSSLFDPFPPEMGTDTAFLDRIHCYIPGWEVPKFRPEHFTNDYGFITDYLAEFLRELRKEQCGDALDKWFKLGKNLNQRDTIAVRKMVGGFVKLLYPDGNYTKDDIEEILRNSLEMRRRVKEQLKKLGGMEFYDVNFSYIDSETFEEHYVSVPEQGGDKLIPEGICNPGQVYTISQGKSGMIGVFRLESQILPGNGKFDRTGLGSDRDCREATNTAFNFLKANAARISGSISTTAKNYNIDYQDLQGIGMTNKLALPTLIALCSIALERPVLSSLAVLGEISIGGTIIKVEELANTLQVCLDNGAKKVLLPATSMIDFATVPADLMSAFQIIPYQSAEDAVFKALGVE